MHIRTCTHARVQPTYQAERPAVALRVKTFKRLAEHIRETSREILAWPVVVAPSWATALFAQTTAEPLNGGLSQKPERTTGGEGRSPTGLSGVVYVSFSHVCLGECR